MPRYVLIFCLAIFLPGFAFNAGRVDAAEALTVDAPDGGALQQVVKKVRQMRRDGETAPITITLAEGAYRLDRPLVLDATTVGEGLSLRGASNGKTVISGAIALTDVRRDGDAWRYSLPKAAADQASIPRVILVDGELRTAARHPDVGYLRVDEAAEDRRSGFRFNVDELPADLDLDRGVCDLVFLHDWSTSRLPVADIDREQSSLTTVGPIGCSASHYAIDHFEKHPRFYLEGHPAFANRGGEWFIDRSRKELVVIAGKEDMPPQVEFPLLESLIVADAGSQPVRGLEFRGLRFSGTRFPLTAGGLAAAQATMHEPRDANGQRLTEHRPMLSAAVRLEHTDRVVFANCTFRGIGNTGLWIGSRAFGSQVSGCVFNDIGGNAINIGEDNHRRVDGRVWYQAAPEQVPTGNRITDCRISRCGVVLSGSVAIWAPLNKQLLVSDNEVFDCPYTGISLGWIWNDSPSPAADNRIVNNRIHHVMQVLSDGGGIYTLGRQPGSELAGNVVTNVPLNLGRAESNGFFMDEGSSGFEVHGNQFRRIARSPIRFHKAGENHVHHNRWELETEQTPPVRYNNTPEENIRLESNDPLAREPRIYLIGNSLTWDTRPSLLEHYVDWHVDCGKNLDYIRANPADPCVDSSRLWPTTLQQLQYDYLSVQPHYGTTLTEDVEAISHWMRMQPAAIVVIHQGWARNASEAEEFAAEGSDQMGHRPAYYERLVDALRERFPDRDIRQTHSTEVLHRIAEDVRQGRAPLKQLSELYRDAIHMTHDGGRYLMHNLMRVALDQPPSGEGFAAINEQPDLKRYLDAFIAERVASSAE